MLTHSAPTEGSHRKSQDRSFLSTDELECFLVLTKKFRRLLVCCGKHARKFMRLGSRSTQAMKYLTQIQQERPRCLNFSFFSPKRWNELGGKKRGSLVWPELRSFSAFRGAHKLPSVNALLNSASVGGLYIIVLLTWKAITAQCPQVFLKGSHKVAAGCSGES